MYASVRHVFIWSGLAVSLAVACASEPPPSADPPRVSSADMGAPDPATPTPSPAPDGRMTDGAPSPPAAGADAQVPVPLPPLGDTSDVLVLEGDIDRPADDDLILENFLFDQLNLFVTVADDEERAAILSRIDLIVISPTVDSTTLGDRYRMVALPMVVMRAEQFAALGMTGSQPGDFGTASGTEVLVTPAGAVHTIGLGEPGLRQIAPAPIRLPFGVPAAGATVVATLADNPDRAAVFFYEQGAAMSTLVAPHHRVGVFFDGDDDVTAAGEALIERAIFWANLSF
jgi:hypothetical protein